MLGANVLDQEGGYLTGAGWTIVERDGVRLAVIGVCTPAVPIWDPEQEGVDTTVFTSGSEGVARALAEIGDQADLILVSAHMGQYAEYFKETGADSAVQLVADHPEIDILQVAHQHITVNDRIGSVPVVGVRNQGREIARLDVYLDEANQLIRCETQIVDMADVEPSEELRAIPLIQEAHEKACVLTGATGENGEKTGIVLGSTTARFQPENEIVGLPEGRLQDTAVLDLINRVQLEASGADVSACSLFRDTSDLPEGAIYYGDIFDIYKYDNTLYRVPMTGAELKAYMEWAVSGYNQWREGDINISFDVDRPGYLLDAFAGVDYEINLSKPVGERIEHLMFRGEPLAEDEVLLVAVNNYRYSSALKAANLTEGQKEWESSEAVRELIVDWFLAHSPVEPQVDHNWTITGVDLEEDDPRRLELIGYINEGLLPVPYYESYNLADYEALVAQAEEQRALSEEERTVAETDFSH